MNSLFSRHLVLCALLVLFILALSLLQIITASILPFNEAEALLAMQSQTLEWGAVTQPAFVHWMLSLWQHTHALFTFTNQEVWLRSFSITCALLTYLALYGCARTYFKTDAWSLWAWTLLFCALLPMAHYATLFNATATTFGLLYLIFLIVVFWWLPNTNHITFSIVLAFVVFSLVNVHFIAWLLVPLLLLLLLSFAFYRLRTSYGYWSIWCVYLIALLPTFYWNYTTNWSTFSYLQTQMVLPIAWQDVVVQEVLLTSIAGLIAIPIATYTAIKRWSEPNLRLLYCAALFLWLCGIAFALFHIANILIITVAHLLFVLLLVRHVAWHKVKSALGYVWLLSLSYGAVAGICFYLLYAALAVPFPRFMSPLTEFLGVKESISLIDAFETQRLRMLDAQQNQQNTTNQDSQEEVFFADDVGYIFTDSAEDIARLSWYAGASRVVYIGDSTDEQLIAGWGSPPPQSGMSGYILVNDNATARRLHHEDKFAQCQLLSSSVYRGNTDNPITRMHIYQCAGYKPPSQQ